jgi:competence protein ComEC
MLENAPKEDASLAVIQALLLGYKRGVDPETRQAFQLSGTAHILAVSGMHVGLVLTLWLFLLRRFPPLWSHHPVSQVALLFWIVFYGLLTGASPSAMRAVIMSSVALIARMLYKPYFALNALGFAAFLQLSFSPTLLYDVGFQLSYAAVGGILAFYTGVLKLLRYTPKDSSILKYLKELIAISVAAQAGTFLLGWAYFGRLPLYFLVANLLAVPVATGLTFVGMFWLFCLPIPVLAKLVAWGPHLLAKLLIAIVYFLSQLPGASVELPRFPPGMAALLSLLLLIGGGVLVERYLRKGETPWVV